MKIIKKWWFCTIIAIIMLFGIPIVINELYKLNRGYLTIWGASDVLSFYGAVLSFVGTVSLGALALWQNHLINKQHLEGMRPALCMRLTSDDYFLYLKVENTGMTTAKDILITVLELQNNGNIKDLELDGLFGTSFELHPKETVQGRLAINGANIYQEIYPKVKIKVSYTEPNYTKKVEFERTVIYDGISLSNNDNEAITNIQSDIDKVARASVRIANYLDGYKATKLDELDIISCRSLKTDLIEVKKKQIITNGTNSPNSSESEEDEHA